MRQVRLTPGAVFIFISLAWGHFAHAVPFDLIVPKEVEVSTDLPPGRYSIGNNWGYVVATTEPIHEDHFDDAVYSRAANNDLVDPRFETFFNHRTILPGEVRASTHGVHSNALFPFVMRLQETYSQPRWPFWAYNYVISAGSEGETVVQNSVVIGDESTGFHIARYATLFRLSPSFSGRRAVLGQRVSAVPVPEPEAFWMAAVLAVALALICRWRGYRTQLLMSAPLRSARLSP